MFPVFCSLALSLPRGFTKYWDGGSEMSRITGNKRNVGVNSPVGGGLPCENNGGACRTI